MSKNYQKVVFITISFLYTTSCSDNAPDTSGEQEIINYIEKVTGSKNYDYKSKEKELLSQIAQLANKNTELGRKSFKLAEDCGRRCEKEINDIQKKINDGSKIMLLKAEERFKLKLERVTPQHAIYGAIEYNCGRENRSLFYKSYIANSINRLDVNFSTALGDYNEMYEKVFTETEYDIKFDILKVNCSWEALDTIYSVLRTSSNDRF